VRVPVRVLIIEDSEDDAVLLLRELTASGYAPVSERVETAEQMRAALDARAWDLVIADHTLPGFDSLAALALLKERGLDVPFIIVSGTIGDETAVAVMKAGAHDYIAKNARTRLSAAIGRELQEAARRIETRQTAHRREREAEALALIARETAENLALPVLTQRIADRVLVLFGAASACVRLKDEGGGLVAVALAGVAAVALSPGHAVPWGAGLLGRAGAECRIVWTPDILEEPDAALRDDIALYRGILGQRAVLAAPLRDGPAALGTLSISDPRPRRFTEAELSLFQALADQAALAVRNGQLLAREQAARAAADAANRAKDEFLATLGHELRNPLGVITSGMALLDRIGSGNARVVRTRAALKAQTRHLARLVDDLLDVARVTMGQLTLARQPIDLADAVERVVSALRQSGRLRGHRVETHLNTAWVDADATRAEQIITNLVGNALKYTPAGGWIALHTLVAGDEALLRVEDGGIGIAADRLPHVFDPFTRGDRQPDGAQSGLGIGLALVRRLVELHGGRAEARSEGPGTGSVFTVRLPRVFDPPAAPPEGPVPERGARRRVLLVDDNDEAREILREVLALDGHVVDTAPDGPRALHLAASLHPDVIVVDIGLPGMDGYEVAQRVRAMPDARRARLVALTGYGQKRDRDRGYQAGFDEYLVKPVEPETLARAISAAETRGPR
jgi:signal transduction histidine kinase/DNA-binding response OmpR family regulator